LKQLLSYLKDYKTESILGPLFKLLEASFELMIPLVVAAMIDRGIGGGDRGYIIRMCLVLVSLGIVGMVSSVTAQYFAAKAAAGFAKQLKHALFAHIQSLSFSELDRCGTSTMITRMTSDMNQLQSSVNMTLRLLLRSPFIVFGAMIMAFTIDTRAALIFAAAIPALSAAVFGIMLLSIPLYQKVQAGLDRVLGITRENLAGVRVIRAFCKEDEEIREFEVDHGALTRLQIFAGKISALLNPITYIMINAAVLVLLWVGAVRVNEGFITQGSVVALYNYMAQILVELIKMASLIIMLTKSVACGNRIQAVLELRSDLVSPETSPAASAGALAVEFRHVSLRYQNAGDEALTDLTFTMRRGEVIGIIGGTGAGKSSLVNLIPRFYDATDGAVLVDGINVKAYPLDELRHKIGVVPQKAVLFQGTIRDNLRWGKNNATDEELFDALAVAQATEVVNVKGGLDFQLEQGGKNLSGGQRQRLTIARALVRQPELLILDDSSSALDFATDAALRQAMMKLNPRPTVLIVSQRASALQHADQIIVLDDGKIAGIGKNKELLKSCGVYQEIYESQFRKEAAADGKA